MLALDGVLDSSLGVTLDVLAGTNRLLALSGRPALFDFAVLGVDGRTVRTGAGIELRAGGTLKRARGFDLVIVPGLHAPSPAELGQTLVRPDVRCAIAWLAAEHGRGATVAGSCVASFLLAEAGLLEGRPATTSWWLAGEFRARYPHVDLQVDQMVTTDGRVLCAGAALAQMDLGLALVTRLAGPRIAARLARFLVLERRPSQARYAASALLASSSPDVSRAESWIRAHVAEPFRVEAVARAAGLSPRTMARRITRATGLSPLRFVQRIRAEQAVHLLETTPAPFDEVARRVGYADPSALRRVLRREVGTTARAIRSARAARGGRATRRSSSSGSTGTGRR